jgi:hypothetical protein
MKEKKKERKREREKEREKERKREWFSSGLADRLDRWTWRGVA